MSGPGTPVGRGAFAEADPAVAVEWGADPLATAKGTVCGRQTASPLYRPPAAHCDGGQPRPRTRRSAQHPTTSTTSGRAIAAARLRPAQACRHGRDTPSPQQPPPPNRIVL
jgi:hypothetical protein